MDLAGWPPRNFNSTTIAPQVHFIQAFFSLSTQCVSQSARGLTSEDMLNPLFPDRMGVGGWRTQQYQVTRLSRFGRFLQICFSEWVARVTSDTLSLPHRQEAVVKVTVIVMSHLESSC